MSQSMTTRHAQVVSLWKSGASIRDIALETGYCEGSVSQIARRYDLPPRGLAHATEIENTPEFRKLWDSNKSMRAIATVLGCSETTVRRHAKAFRYPHRDTCPNTREFRELWDSGKPMTEISKRMGCSVATVKRYAHLHGYKPRGPQPTPAKTPDTPKKPVNPLLATGGKYKELAKLADSMGLTLTQVQQQYHRARVVSS